MVKVHGNMGAEIDVSGDSTVSPLVVKDSTGANALVVERDGDVVIGDTTFSETELAYLDGLTPGTVTASKAVVVSADKDIATFRHVTLSGNLVSGATTLAETDLAKIDGITNGTSAANKAVVLDASSKINALDITALTLNGTAVTSTASELNILDGVTATATEINHLDNADRLPKTVKVALTPNGGAGTIMSWQNTEESSDIIVTQLLLDITTGSTPAATLEGGVSATDATSSTLLTAVDAQVIALTDSMDATLDTGTNAHAQKVTDDYWVTIYGSGATSGIAGNAYITYIVV